MRLLTYLFLVVGSSFLLLNFTAIWEPYEFDWITTLIGFLMIVIGGILKAGLNLHDEEQQAKSAERFIYLHGNVSKGFDPDEFDEDGKRFPGSFGGDDE